MTDYKKSWRYHHTYEKPDGLNGLRFGDFADFCRIAFRPEDRDRMKTLAYALLDAYSEDRINAAAWKFLNINKKKEILNPIRYLKGICEKLPEDEIQAWRMSFYRKNQPEPAKVGWQPPALPNDLLSYEENRARCQELLQTLARIKSPWAQRA